MASLNDNILYEDRELIIVNKKAGEPTQSDLSGDKDLFSKTKKLFGEELYLVNRLDRPVSGIVVFAKSKESYNSLKQKWQESNVVKEYFAIVEGKWSTTPVMVTQRIKKGRGSKAIIHQEGKESSLTVEAFPVFDHYSLCRIQLHTGRFHQIRLLLSKEGYPIKGDVKYGARRKNVDRSIYLHAYRLKLGDIEVTAPFPEEDKLWKLAGEFYIKSLS